MLSKIYPWQTGLYNQLVSDQENMPHAMLMCGPTGIGKLAFAQSLAAHMLCERTVISDGGEPAACGSCSSCIWLASGNHPDFRLIQPDNDDETEPRLDQESPAVLSKASSGQGPIRVDQVRGLLDFVYLGSHRHGKRIVVVSPAESMNPAAANALLKVLEEPPAGVYFILVSSAWRRLVPTLRSRCRIINFGRPDELLAERWLEESGVKNCSQLLRLAAGAPLLASSWAEQGRMGSYHKVIDALSASPLDPVAVASKWSVELKKGADFGLQQLVESVEKWVFDLVLLKSTGMVRYHAAWREQLEVLAANASVVGLSACYQELLRIRAVARHPLNTQLFLEDLATRYIRSLIAGRLS